MISALVLDYGGVLSLPQCDRQMASMARRLGAPLEEFRHAYAEHRGAYDSGLEVEEYWRRVLASIVVRASSVARASRAARGGRHRLVGLLPRGGLGHRPQLPGFGRPHGALDEQHTASHGKTSVTRSAPIPFRRGRRVLRGRRLQTGSGDLSNLEALDVPAAEALFVDDHPPNIAEANRAGMQTLLFDGENVIPTLRRMLAIEASS